MFSVSRPIDVAVLNCCVTETKETRAARSLDDAGEVEQRAGQPIDLVDDDAIDDARLDVAQQPLQSRPLHVAAGEAAVVVAVGQQVQPSCFWLAM